MTTQEKLENFYKKESPWKEVLGVLRTYLNSTELKEDWKWSFPTYTLNGQNVIATASFKNHFGLWFFQGALIKDPDNRLHNAQEGKTKAMRHLHFKSADSLDMNVIEDFTNQAIANALQEKKIEIKRVKKETILPQQLKGALSNDINLMTGFTALSSGKQREYGEYITDAKQEATKKRRLEKIIPMILDGKGLNDKYRK